MHEVDEGAVRKLVRDAVERALSCEAAGSAAASPSSAATSPSGAAASPSASPSSGAKSRRVAIGSDHGGFALKEIIKRYVVDELGWDVHDCGTHSTEAVDYPDFAAAVGREVASGRCSHGVVVDAAGIGSTMAANKVPGVRCALCHDDATAMNAREHNDANVLALGAKVVNRGLATKLVRLFLTTPFGGGRHERRVQKIMALERGR